MRSGLCGYREPKLYDYASSICYIRVSSSKTIGDERDKGFRKKANTTCCRLFHLYSYAVFRNRIQLLDRVGNVGVSAPTADRQTQAAPVLESGIAT